MPSLDFDVDETWEEEEESLVMHEGPVYLRTSSDNFRLLYAVLSKMGELYLYENQKDVKYKMMH